jgi:hypothetical protein
MTTTDTSVESQPFQAEVSELLHLMVHSVYSETDIFLARSMTWRRCCLSGEQKRSLNSK